MELKVWNDFVNSGIIPESILIKIAIKIKNDKKLTLKELSIYTTYSKEIENKLNSWI